MALKPAVELWGTPRRGRPRWRIDVLALDARIKAGTLTGSEREFVERLCPGFIDKVKSVAGGGTDGGEGRMSRVASVKEERRPEYTFGTPSLCDCQECHDGFHCRTCLCCCSMAVLRDRLRKARARMRALKAVLGSL